MSNYYQYTKHPITGKWEKATWIDNYFKQHHYGVQFPDDSMIYDPWIRDLVTDINEEEANILNAAKAQDKDLLHKLIYPDIIGIL